MPGARLFHRSGRSASKRELRAVAFSVFGALAIVAALAPIAEAGVSAQHNETLVVV